MAGLHLGFAYRWGWPTIRWQSIEDGHLGGCCGLGGLTLVTDEGLLPETVV